MRKVYLSYSQNNKILWLPNMANTLCRNSRGAQSNPNPYLYQPYYPHKRLLICSSGQYICSLGLSICSFSFALHGIRTTAIPNTGYLGFLVTRFPWICSLFYSNLLRAISNSVISNLSLSRTMCEPPWPKLTPLIELIRMVTDWQQETMDCSWKVIRLYY